MATGAGGAVMWGRECPPEVGGLPGVPVSSALEVLEELLALFWPRFPNGNHDPRLLSLESCTVSVITTCSVVDGEILNCWFYFSGDR